MEKIYPKVLINIRRFYSKVQNKLIILKQMYFYLKIFDKVK